MYKFKLTLGNTITLTQFLDSLLPKDCGDMKSVRLITGSVTDLQNQTKSVTDFLADLNVKRKAFLELYLPKLEAMKAAIDTAENKKLAEQELKEEDKRVVEKANEFLKPEYEKFDEMSKQEVELELSTDKFDKVRDMFTAKAIEVVLRKDVCVAIDEALQSAVKGE